MVQKYVRDFRGRFANVPAANLKAGDVMVTGRGDGEPGFRSTITGTKVTATGRISIKFKSEGFEKEGSITRAASERFEIELPDSAEPKTVATPNNEDRRVARNSDGITAGTSRKPVMIGKTSVAAGFESKKVYRVEGGPPDGFKTRAEAQRYQARQKERQQRAQDGGIDQSMGLDSSGRSIAIWGPQRVQPKYSLQGNKISEAFGKMNDDQRRRVNEGLDAGENPSVAIKRGKRPGSMTSAESAATEKRMADLRQEARDKAKARRQARNAPEAVAQREAAATAASNSPAIKQLREELASGALTVDTNGVLGDKIKAAARAEAKRARARARRAKLKAGN